MPISQGTDRDGALSRRVARIIALRLPWHRIERLEHIVNWFEIYLQGKKIPGYEPGQENAWK